MNKKTTTQMDKRFEQELPKGGQVMPSEDINCLLQLPGHANWNHNVKLQPTHQNGYNLKCWLCCGATGTVNGKINWCKHIGNLFDCIIKAKHNVLRSSKFAPVYVPMEMHAYMFKSHGWIICKSRNGKKKKLFGNYTSI